jgi:DNA repair exonuclease SbcCD ATPase subunit
VKGILGCVGTRENEGQTWLTPDGRWQHGLLRGAWRKPDAEYLGHNSREEARRRRITELEAVLATIEELIARLARERKAIEVRAARIASERAGAPSVGRLQRAAHELESAESASAEARQRLDEIDQLLSKAIEAEREARDTRDRDAADLDLTPWKEPSALTKLELLLADVRVKAAALWPAWHALLGARSALGNATDRETESQVSLDVAAGRVEEARKLAAAANAHFETLRSSVGTTVNEVLHRLSAVRGEPRKTRARE